MNDSQSTEPSTPNLPKRPPHPHENARQTLKEAFPNTDDAVIRAVLAASGYKLEPAFNALLGFNDPKVAEELEAMTLEETTSTSATTPNGSTVLSEKSTPSTTAGTETRPAPEDEAKLRQRQYEEDERLARKLAQKYEREARRSALARSTRAAMGYDGTVPYGNVSGAAAVPVMQQRSPQSQQVPAESRKERSFFDDDLPVLKENISREFQAIKQRSMAWMGRLRARIEEEFNKDTDDSDDEIPYGPKSSEVDASSVTATTAYAVSTQATRSRRTPSNAATDAAAPLESAYETPPRVPLRRKTPQMLPPYETDPYMLSEHDFDQLRSLESSRGDTKSQTPSILSLSSRRPRKSLEEQIVEHDAEVVPSDAFALDESDAESEEDRAGERKQEQEQKQKQEEKGKKQKEEEIEVGGKTENKEAANIAADQKNPESKSETKAAKDEGEDKSDAVKEPNTEKDSKDEEKTNTTAKADTKSVPETVSEKTKDETGTTETSSSPDKTGPAAQKKEAAAAAAATAATPSKSTD